MIRELAQLLDAYDFYVNKVSLHIMLGFSKVIYLLLCLLFHVMYLVLVLQHGNHGNVNTDVKKEELVCPTISERCNELACNTKSNYIFSRPYFCANYVSMALTCFLVKLQVYGFESCFHY